MRRPVTIAVGLLAALGIALRWWVTHGDLGLLDGDEGVVGIQALRFAAGDEAAFFLGQSYGGTLEAFLASIPARAFGGEVWVLRVTAATLSLVSVVLVYLLARRALPDRRGALLAAATMFAWPAVYVWFGTRTMGFYSSSLALGLATCTLLVTIADDRRWRWYLLLGLVAGLAWWQSPYLVYFVVPALAWLVARRRWQALLRLPAAVPTAVLGAAPWLLANVGKGFPSLDAEPYGGYAGTYLGKVAYVLHTGLPVAVGLKQPYTSLWARGDVGRVAYLVVLAAIVVLVAVGLRHRRLAAFGLVAFPWLYALNPVGTTSAHGRYFLFLSPWLALLAGEVAARDRARLGAVAAVLAFTTVLGAGTLADVPWRGLNRPPTDAVSAAMVEDGYRHAFADYFLAYKLSYESDAEVLVSPFGAVRDLREAATVRAAERLAYVFVSWDPNLPRAREGFDRLGVDVVERGVGDYVVIEPERRVLPEELSSEPLGV